MIVAESLTKSFGGREAVSSLSFSTLKGEIFGIVGPDGAGKSTLLRMAAAILRPDSGNLSIDGMDVSGNPYSIKERLAYMPQRFGLYEDLTVEENIYFFGRLFGRSKRQVRAGLDRLYGFSRLGPFRDRLAGKLSGGMKQKLGLACCLVHAPDLILLDEPTNGVDPVSRREFWDLLGEFTQEGMAVLISTPYMDEAARCHRVGLVHHGRTLQQGPPADLVRGFRHAVLRVVSGDRDAVLSTLGSMPGVLATSPSGARMRIVIEQGAEAAIVQGLCACGATAERAAPDFEDLFLSLVAKESN